MKQQMIDRFSTHYRNSKEGQYTTLQIWNMAGLVCVDIVPTQDTKPADYTATYTDIAELVHWVTSLGATERRRELRNGCLMTYTLVKGNADH